MRSSQAEDTIFNYNDDIVIPAIVVEAIMGLEQSLNNYTKMSSRYRHLKLIDCFYIKTLLNYIKNATADERRAVAKLLRLKE